MINRNSRKLRGIILLRLEQLISTKQIDLSIPITSLID